ncbi:DUF6301 family protein [Nocardia coubleae]|uniref:Uncharacterized protein n=1 Tax=Nocardia coubleae TaxID=356147 RepID=A0A846VZ32_9NOCA|nr:DUF6301 family protein [Nocardia coubleae]NKX86102.1 hypothetical protein [Nocardia coubleae]
MQVDIERATRAIREAAMFDWTWGVDDLDSFCTRAGWELAELRKKGATLTTNLEVNRTDAIAYISSGAYPFGTVTQLQLISFYPADIGDLDASEIGSQEMGIFLDLRERISSLMGQPIFALTGPHPVARWNGGRVVILLRAYVGQVHIDIVNPENAVWLGDLDSDDNF